MPWTWNCLDQLDVCQDAEMSAEQSASQPGWISNKPHMKTLLFCDLGSYVELSEILRTPFHFERFVIILNSSVAKSWADPFVPSGFHASHSPKQPSTSDNRLVVSTWTSIKIKLEGMKNRSKELKPQSKHHHSLFGAEKHRHIDLFPLHVLQCLQPSDEARSRKREIHPKEEITSIMSMAQFLHGRFPGCGFWGKWRICHATVQNQGSKCHWRIQIHDKFNGTCDNL